MSLGDQPEWVRELLDERPVARLAFVDDEDHPRVLPIVFAVAAGAVWSVIDEKPKRSLQPARLRYLTRRPQAALCVDRYDDDWSQLAWVQILGRVTLVDIDAAPDALAALTDRYAAYRERRPPGPLLRLEVERVLSWHA